MSAIPWVEALDRKVFLAVWGELKDDDFASKAFLRVLYRKSYPHWPEFAP